MSLKTCWMYGRLVKYLTYSKFCPWHMSHLGKWEAGFLFFSLLRLRRKCEGTLSPRRNRPMSSPPVMSALSLRVLWGRCYLVRQKKLSHKKTTTVPTSPPPRAATTAAAAEAAATTTTITTTSSSSSSSSSTVTTHKRSWPEKTCMSFSQGPSPLLRRRKAVGSPAFLLFLLLLLLQSPRRRRTSPVWRRPEIIFL